MLKQRAILFNRLNLLVDLLVVLSAFFLAYVLRSKLGGLHPFNEYLWILLAAFPVWGLLLARHGFYASLRRRSLYQIVTALINVHLIAGMTGASLIFLLEPRGVSRTFYLAFVVLAFLLLTLEKVALRLVLGSIRSRGYNYRNILLVGTQEEALHFHRHFQGYVDWGFKVVGFVKVNGEILPETLEGTPVLGSLKDLIELCKTFSVDEVVFCLNKQKEQVVDVEDYLRDLEEIGVTVRMILASYNIYRSRRELEFFDDQTPMLTFHSKAFEAHQLFLKRMLDIFGALVGLGITASLFPFIALAIRRDSPGPIFFAQERVGEQGRIFRLWKFRSMYLDAEERKKDLLDRNEMEGALFKIKDDPRITRVGRFLRRSSLDELPQFYNVLRGEMSLVGTRPPTPEEVSQYKNCQRRRISIQPGITGLWQVSGRNNINNFDEVVRLDLSYIDNWSLWMDTKILMRTLRIVFLGTGSC
jgi:exopolysaccharide biosynthesis polyprenyl glycosylphosphotransferase